MSQSVKAILDQQDLPKELKEADISFESPTENLNLGQATVMPSRNQHNSPDASEGLRHEVAEGLLYAHSRVNANTSKTLESASFLYALVELLSEKGVITVEELDERKQVMGQRLAKQFSEKGMGVMLQTPEDDKYAFKDEVRIDCENRVHLCKAACCRLPFALSKQDVREGIVRWNLGQPYLIAHEKDGYCTHLARSRRCCTVWRNRPVPCRGFDCRNDKRIWADFENRIVSPELEKLLSLCSAT